MCLHRLSAQLSFIFCMSMGNAFRLPRGLVPRQGEPVGVRVGGKPAGGSKAGQSIELSEALRRGNRGAGIAGTQRLDAGSLEPWATPPGAQNKHNGQSLAEPGGLAQGDGVMVLPRAGRPRAPPPPPPPPRLVTRPAGLGAGFLRRSTPAALCSCQAVGLWRRRFLDVVRGACPRGRHEGAPERESCAGAFAWSRGYAPWFCYPKRDRGGLTGGGGAQGYCAGGHPVGGQGCEEG